MVIFQLAWNKKTMMAQFLWCNCRIVLKNNLTCTLLHLLQDSIDELDHTCTAYHDRKVTCTISNKCIKKNINSTCPKDFDRHAGIPSYSSVKDFAKKSTTVIV